MQGCLRRFWLVRGNHSNYGNERAEQKKANRLQVTFIPPHAPNGVDGGQRQPIGEKNCSDDIRNAHPRNIAQIRGRGRGQSSPV